MNPFRRMAYFVRREALMNKVDVLVAENAILKMRLDMAKARAASFERALSSMKGDHYGN